MSAYLFFAKYVVEKMYTEPTLKIRVQKKGLTGADWGSKGLTGAQKD